MISRTAIILTGNKIHTPYLYFLKTGMVTKLILRHSFYFIGVHRDMTITSKSLARPWREADQQTLIKSNHCAWF